MPVHIVKKHQYYGIPFTFISSLYNHYQPLRLLINEKILEIHPQYSQNKISTQLTTDTTSKAW